MTHKYERKEILLAILNGSILGINISNQKYDTTLAEFLFMLAIIIGALLFTIFIYRTHRLDHRRLITFSSFALMSTMLDFNNYRNAVNFSASYSILIFSAVLVSYIFTLNQILFLYNGKNQKLFLSDAKPKNATFDEYLSNLYTNKYQLFFGKKIRIYLKHQLTTYPTGTVSGIRTPSMVLSKVFLDTLNEKEQEMLILHELGHFVGKHVFRNLTLIIGQYIALIFGVFSLAHVFLTNLTLTNITEIYIFALSISFFIVLLIHRAFKKEIMKEQVYADSYAIRHGDKNSLFTLLEKLEKFALLNYPSWNILRVSDEIEFRKKHLTDVQ